MTLNISDAPPRRTLSVWIAAVTAVAMAAAVLAMTPTRANAVASPVPLGTAASFGVLAGATVTNTGPTVVNGLNVGVSPGTAITGFQTSDGGPGIVTPPGVLHRADAVAGQAKIDLNTAYNQAAGQTLRDATYNDAPHEFGGQTLTPGLYKANSSAGITGTLTLDAQGNSSAVWVFQIGSTLKTASASSVSFINGASPCNVYWQVGSSATLGTYSTFVGTILADTSITATTGAIINGRLLADAGLRGDGAVTLDSNRIFQGPCGTGATGGTTGAVVAGATAGGSTGASTVGVIAERADGRRNRWRPGWSPRRRPDDRRHHGRSARRPRRGRYDERDHGCHLGRCPWRRDRRDRASPWRQAGPARRPLRKAGEAGWPLRKAREAGSPRSRWEARKPRRLRRVRQQAQEGQRLRQRSSLSRTRVLEGTGGAWRIVVDSVARRRRKPRRSSERSRDRKAGWGRAE